MARLLDAPLQYPQWPLHYLIGCYGRATAETRQLSTVRDKDAANRLQQDLQYCKELIASNAGLLLTMSDSLFPQVGTLRLRFAEYTLLQYSIGADLAHTSPLLQHSQTQGYGPKQCTA